MHSQKYPRTVYLPNGTGRRAQFRLGFGMSITPAFARHACANSLHNAVRSLETTDCKAIFIIPVPLPRRSTGIAVVHVCAATANRCLSFCSTARRLWKDVAEFPDRICRTSYYCRPIFCSAQIDILINGYTKISCPSLLAEVSQQISATKSGTVLTVKWKM